MSESLEGESKMRQSSQTLMLFEIDFARKNVEHSSAWTRSR